MSRLLSGYLLWLVITASILSACSPSPARPTPQIPYQTSWSYADLRLLDPADAPEPAQDLLAVYINRPSGRNSPLIDIRLDFLDLSTHSQPDVYIALDYAYGGHSKLPLDSHTKLAWDVLLVLPAAGRILAVDKENRPLHDLQLRVIRDTGLDSLDIRLDASALFPSSDNLTLPEFKLQVFVTSAGLRRVSDASAVVRSFDPPPEPANLLLAFWNTYPAYTPAQALRRWDGAHTGPLGGRHGLANLLRAAHSARMPIVLLDLKYPAWLSALDYGGDLQMLNSLVTEGVVSLPEVIPPSPNPLWHAYSAQLAGQFDQPAQNIGYTQFANIIPADYALIAFPKQQVSPVTRIYRHSGQSLLPIPDAAAQKPGLQPDINGLTLDIRRLLVDTAVSGNSSQLVALGGDLTGSAWGNPQVARAAFRYIRTHPWIRPLDTQALLTLPAGNDKPGIAEDLTAHFARLPQNETTHQLAEFALKQRAQPQPNPLIEAAAQAYLALAPPSALASPEFDALQQIYLRQINVLLAAAEWSQNPVSTSTCSLDIDGDSGTECVLASEHVYAVIEPQLGVLTHLFAINETGVHQIIAPSSQFTFGTGDPSTWDPQLDLAADPQVLPGAFYDNGGPYDAHLSEAVLTLNKHDDSRMKYFTLNPGGIQIEYISAEPVSTQIHLALDPWNRFYPDWEQGYNGSSIPGGWSWSVAPGITVSINTIGRFNPSAFTDTFGMMKQVENPNAEILPGHYLPFPLGILDISGVVGFSVDIEVTQGVTY